MNKFQRYFEKKLLARTTDLLRKVMQELANEIGGQTQRQLAAALTKRTKTDEELRQELLQMVQELSKAK